MAVVGFILLSAAVQICLIYIYLLRRQIKSICRQLAFHRREESNKEIMTDMDSTDIKHLQDELNLLLSDFRSKRFEYERVDKELKDMIANVSHDIRTPLTSVSGYVQLLNDTNDEAERRHYISVIDGRLSALNELLENLFEYTKIRSGAASGELELLDVNQILCETLFLFYDDFEHDNRTPNIDIQDEKIEIYGRRDNLRRIIQNVIKNAWVHGCGALNVSLKQENELAVICIENETAEKLPDNMEDVFERFFKSDSSRGQTSSGLGLSIVKEMTEQIKGRAQAYSRKPSMFGIRLEFPLAGSRKK